MLILKIRLNIHENGSHQPKTFETRQLHVRFLISLECSSKSANTPLQGIPPNISKPKGSVIKDITDPYTATLSACP